jgi:hypothetical protein
MILESGHTIGFVRTLFEHIVNDGIDFKLGDFGQCTYELAICWDSVAIEKL